MSIDSVLDRIDEIENRIASLFPRQTPPTAIAKTLGAATDASPSGAVAAAPSLQTASTGSPFNVALAEASSQAHVRPLAVSVPADTDALIQKCSTQHGLDPNVVRAVIKAESDGDTKCVSNKGAMGLMQLMPDEVRAYGISNPFDPAQNIEGGCRQLQEKLKLFGGDLSLALAAYNAGSGAVRKYGGIPPYPETRAYVSKIMGMLGHK